MVKYIDLCSGIGGFRIAIENMETTPFECVLSADIKQDAIDTYNINFKENNVKKNIYSINPAEIQSFDLLITHNRLQSLFNFNINDLFIKCLPKILNIQIGQDETLLQVIRLLNIRYDTPLAEALNLTNIHHTSNIIGEDILNYIRDHNMDLTEFFATNPLNLTYIDLLNMAVNFYIIIVHLLEYRRGSIWENQHLVLAGPRAVAAAVTQLLTDRDFRSRIYQNLILAMEDIFPNINMIINIEQFLNLLTRSWSEIIKMTFFGGSDTHDDDDDDY